MRRAVLGTAGHIDHGKTALVRALTGVDTDRLREEKERGITIDLGFAELREEGGSRAAGGDVAAGGTGSAAQGGPDAGAPPGAGDEPLVLGVVDVPGHEDFVRTMVAGASGMDLVLLVVAADEGVMPQTREHLAVVELLGVPEMVVAITKADLVEPAWLELVEEELRETLAPGPWPRAPMVATSAETAQGLEELRRLLFRVARAGSRRRMDDLVRLPVDRSFTVQGTGTVVTGTLWSGAVETGDALRVLPGGVEARVRGIQHHGQDVDRAEAGARTAVALAGGAVDRESVGRGHTLVADASWPETHMLTVRARVLPGTGWRLEHNQRVHLHLGTHEVRARCALLDGDALEGGEEGWVQLRLEAPVTARARDRVVLRSYSPVTTIAGGRVAEPDPPKRRGGHDAALVARLEAVLDGAPADAVEAAAELAGWAGVERSALPVLTGLPRREAEEGTRALLAGGGAEARGRVVAPAVVEDADARILEELARGHREHPLRPGVSLARLRQALPDWAAPGLADARLEALAEAGRLEVLESGAREPGREVSLSGDQAAAADRLRAIYAEAGLQPPESDALPDPVGDRADLDELLEHLGRTGELVAVGEEFWVAREALDGAVAAVRKLLGGRSGLGPADFREALPVTRKHLIPILGWMDQEGVTLRSGQGRSVPDGGS